MPAMTKALLGRGEVVLKWHLAIAEYIREARLAADLTQAELAEKIGTNSKQFVSGIENGRTSVPPERLKEFADALGIDRQEFTKTVLRYSNPWMYAELYGADRALKAEIAAVGDRINQRRGPR